MGKAKPTDRELVLAAIDTGHITWQCPEDHDGPCGDLGDPAWDALLRLLKPGRKETKRTGP